MVGQKLQEKMDWQSRFLRRLRGADADMFSRQAALELEPEIGTVANQCKRAKTPCAFPNSGNGPS